MTNKKKAKEEKAVEKKADPTDPKPNKPDSKAEQPTSKPSPDNLKRPRRRGILRRRKGGKRKTPVSTLASVTKTDSIVFAALKVAYGWTDKTKLTREEFIRLRDNWLNKPVCEVKS